jgi:hypothetical protein
MVSAAGDRNNSGLTCLASSRRVSIALLFSQVDSCTSAKQGMLKGCCRAVEAGRACFDVEAVMGCRCPPGGILAPPAAAAVDAGSFSASAAAAGSFSVTVATDTLKARDGRRP